MATRGNQLFIPSSWRLEKMIKEAERKFEAARKAALEERFERATRLNRALQRERRQHDVRRHVWAGDNY